MQRITASTGLGIQVNNAANTTVQLAREGSLSLRISAAFVDSDSIPGPTAGDAISYTFVLENSGTVTVWAISLNPTMGDKPVCNPALTSLQLAPGGGTNCTSTYEVRIHVIDGSK